MTDKVTHKALTLLQLFKFKRLVYYTTTRELNGHQQLLKLASCQPHP